MKVPHSVVGRTRPSSQGLGYYSSAGATPAAFGGQVGDALQSLGGTLAAQEALDRNKLEQREEQTQRYQSLRNFGEFETQVKTRLEEAKRAADPSGKGFVKQMETLYAEEEERFLSTSVTPELREEFRYRAGQVKQGIIGNALTFQYAAGDAYFKQGVNDTFNSAKAALDPQTGGDPAKLEAEKARVFENIDTTDLSDIEKRELKRQVAMGLEAVAYKTEVHRERASRPAARVPENIGLIIDDAAARYGVPAEYLRTIAALESGGDPNAKNPDSSAEGLFQFIDDTAKAYGLSNKRNPAQSSDAAARLTRDNMDGLRKVLGREPTVGEVYLAHQQGLGGAVALLRNPDRPATEIVGHDAVRLNGGVPGMTAGQFAALWDKKAGGASTSSLDSDPRFANVPYEDRLALRSDAEREIQQALAAQSAFAQAQIDASVNALKHSIMDGTAGQADIDRAVEDGTLANFSDRKAVQDMLDTKTADVRLYNDATMKMSSEAGIWDPTDEKDMKMQNSLYQNTGGPERLAAMDKAYFENYIVPNAVRSGDIATDAVGTLSGMVRSNNQQRALFALDALRQLQEADPRAFDQRVPDKLASDVEVYSALRNSLSEDELMQRINPMVDQKTRQSHALLETEAKDYLARSKDGLSNLQSRIGEVLEEFDTWAPGKPVISTFPHASRALDMEYQAVFVEEYKKYNDPERAHDATVTFLKKNWGTTTVGGQEVLMRNPPEKTGYGGFAGGTEALARAAREEFGIPEGMRFELLSDDQTKDEWDKFKVANPVSGSVSLVQPPSYMAVWYDADNVPRLVQDAPGKPARAYFTPKPADKLKEMQDLTKKQLIYQYGEFRKKFRDIQFEALQKGLPVPEEYIEEDKKFRSRIEELTPPAEEPQIPNEGFQDNPVVETPTAPWFQ